MKSRFDKKEYDHLMLPRPQDQTHTVTLLKDTVLEFPELYSEIFIAGDSFEQRAFAEMFVRAKCTKAAAPVSADIVVFTGGADVNPALYGEECHSTTRFDPARDAQDILLYETCLKEGIPMFGVCRGAQFLHVMNGGKLYQDVDSHNGDHTMWDLKSKTIVHKVSSVHHQMIRPNKPDNPGMTVLADAMKATTRWCNPEERINGNLADIEAFFYRDTCCLGVQGHPEYRGYFDFLQWTLVQLQDYICSNPDLSALNRQWRMKPELLAERAAIRAARAKTLS